jgi:hypothetical protein
MLSKFREKSVKSSAARSHEQRDLRIPHNTEIRVSTPVEKEYILTMRDFSDSGMYLFCDRSIVEVGDTLEVQTLEFEHAPVILSEVVRVEHQKGFAVKFLVD